MMMTMMTTTMTTMTMMMVRLLTQYSFDSILEIEISFNLISSNKNVIASLVQNFVAPGVDGSPSFKIKSIKK